MRERLSQDSIDAILVAGLDPETYRQLKFFEITALSMLERVQAVNEQLHQDSNAALYVCYTKELASWQKKQPTDWEEEQLKEFKMRQLETMLRDPCFRPTRELSANRDEMEQTVALIRAEAKALYPSLNDDWPPTNFGQEKKKMKKKK